MFPEMNITNSHESKKDSGKTVEPEKTEVLSDYELYCRQQADAFDDELGDERCFGNMAEGVFVRGH